MVAFYIQYENEVYAFTTFSIKWTITSHTKQKCFFNNGGIYYN